jgi:hypothetical protein
MALQSPSTPIGSAVGQMVFGGGNIVSNTFVQWLSSCEERKWDQGMGVGAMGDRLAGRKYRQR